LTPDPSSPRWRLAEANLLKDKALAEDAEREAGRVTDLFRPQHGPLTGNAIQARANADAANAQVQADQASVEKRQTPPRLLHHPIAITGRVGARLVDPGNIVKANETALVTINQLSPIYVTFSVAERHLPSIKEHMQAGPLTVEARYADETDQPATGRLTFVDNQVDTTTGMVRLKGPSTCRSPSLAGAVRQCRPHRYNLSRCGDGALSGGADQPERAVHFRYSQGQHCRNAPR